MGVGIYNTWYPLDKIISTNPLKALTPLGSPKPPPHPRPWSKRPSPNEPEAPTRTSVSAAPGAEARIELGSLNADSAICCSKLLDRFIG